MKISNYYSLNNFWKITPINFCIIIIINLCILKNSLCQPIFFYYPNDCKRSDSFKNKGCFNNVIKFKHKKYLTNNFAISKEGDFITEFTEYAKYDELSYSRLFYGFNGEGRYFLSNQTSYTIEMNIDIDEKAYDENEFFYHYGIYNSKTFFVSIQNTNNKKNQYLFSINAYNSMVELHDLSKDNNNYYIWSIKKFFNLDEKEYYWPHEFEIYDLKKEPSYIISFIPTFVITEELSELFFIKKFHFQSFDDNAYSETRFVKYNDYVGSRIINTFVMNDVNTFAVLAYKETGFNLDLNDNTDIIYNPPYIDIEKPVNRRRVAILNSRKFYLNFYTSNLELYFLIKEMPIYSTYLSNCNLRKLFIKSLYLDDNLVIFIFYYSNSDDDEAFVFEMFRLNYQDQRIEYFPQTTEDYYYNNFKVRYDFYESKSDFVKINNNRVVFIYTGFYYEKIEKRRLEKSKLPHNRMIGILLIDLSDGIEINDYYIDFDRYTPTMKISGALYNNFLLISSIAKKKEGNYFHDCSDELLSLFMIFGYPNGTDTTIDIREYFYNENPGTDKHKFIKFLLDNLTIENNIFGYVPLTFVKIISFPEEIKINQVLNGNESPFDLNNPFIGCFTNMNNDDCSDYVYFKIEQNDKLMKTSQYYYIDYQYIVTEGQAISNEENMQAGRILEFPGLTSYYGRTNRVKFKLCHEYCETCYELSSSNEEQKCESCLPEYQYDYFYFSNKPEFNPEKICVPYGYYYDIEYGELEKCIPSENDYYLNKTDNKTICFKNNENNRCPYPYEVYNETTRECFYCDFERFKKG